MNTPRPSDSERPDPQRQEPQRHEMEHQELQHHRLEHPGSEHSAGKRRCASFRRAVLAQTDPRRLPEVLQRHAAACTTCQKWAEQAARLEGALARLPVPLPDGQQRARRQADTASRSLMQTVASSWTTTRPAGWPSRRWAIPISLAASVLLLAGGWLVVERLFERSEPPLVATPSYPFLERVVQHQVRLARVQRPEERVTVLSDLAEEVEAEARALARLAGPNELRDLARWYEKLVKQGIVRHTAEWVSSRPPLDRQQHLRQWVERLQAAAERTEQMVPQVPPHAQPALQQMATSARDAAETLQRLNEV